MSDRAEMRLQRNVLLRLGSMPDVWIHPNPVGQGYVGAIRPQLSAALCQRCLAVATPILDRGRIRWGLGVGSPDLVGAVGPQGRFFGLELKTEDGRMRAEQDQWHAAATARGLLVGVARSEGEALGLIEEWRTG